MEAIETPPPTETEVPFTPMDFVIEDPNIGPENKNEIILAFADPFKTLQHLELAAQAITITSVDQKKEMKQARELRLQLKAGRVGVEKARKTLKEIPLRIGQAIDKAAAEITSRFEASETRLLEQEQFAERMEAERKAALKRMRLEALAPYEQDTSFFDLENMPEPTFTELVAGLEASRLAKIEAARVAEEARIAAEQKAAEEEKARLAAEAEERERVRIENERLKAEAEERERLAAEERKAVEAERLEFLEKARIAKEEADRAAALAAEEHRKEVARLAAEAEEIRRATEEKQRIADEAARKEREALEAQAMKMRKEADAKIKAEQEARAKVEAEAKAKQDAEDKRKADEAAAAAKAAKAPDKQKLVAFAATVAALELPQLNDKETAMKLAETRARFESFVTGLADKL